MTQVIKKALGILILMVFLTAGVSCSAGSTASKQSAINITDQLGRQVKLDQAPQRIVSLSPSNTEILFSLGLGTRVAGVDTYSIFPDEAKEKPKIGGYSTPDIEKIVALNPDLVVAADIHEKEVIPQLENRGLKVIALAPKSITGVEQAVELIGKTTGSETEANRVVKDMQTRRAAVSALVANLPDSARPRVFYTVWTDPLMTAGHDTLQGQLIEMAGGKNIFQDLASFPTVDLETLVARQPQVIIAGVGMGTGGDNTLRWAESEPRLRNVEALKEGRVFGIDANLVSQSNTRIVDGLEQLFALIHPELAPKLNK